MTKCSVALAVALGLVPTALLAACGDDSPAPSTEAFCAAHAAIGASDFGTSPSADPAALEALLTATAPLFDELRASAPPAVASDAAAVDDAFDRLVAYLAGTGYATPAEPPPADVQAAYETLAAAAYATSPIGAFIEAHCGVDLDEPPS